MLVFGSMHNASFSAKWMKDIIVRNVLYLKPKSNVEYNIICVNTPALHAERIGHVMARIESSEVRYDNAARRKELTGIFCTAISSLEEWVGKCLLARLTRWHEVSPLSVRSVALQFLV